MQTFLRNSRRGVSSSQFSSSFRTCSRSFISDGGDGSGDGGFGGSFAEEVTHPTTSEIVNDDHAVNNGSDSTSSSSSSSSGSSELKTKWKKANWVCLHGIRRFASRRDVEELLEDINHDEIEALIDQQYKLTGKWAVNLANSSLQEFTDSAEIGRAHV